MSKKILLIGGSGYLGNSLAKRFMEEKSFSITIGDLRKPSNSQLEFLELDILDSSNVSSFVKEHDIIVNCTGQITRPINTCFRLNTEGIDNIVGAIELHKKKLFHISTCAVYGTAHYADENSVMNPERSYASCKAFAEYRITKELSAQMFCILRIPNLYGENQLNGLFAYLLKSYLSDKKLVFDNDGTLSRYFLHVDDCADAITKAVNNNLCGTFNVTSIEKYELKEIITLVEKAMGVSFKKKFDEVSPTENIEKISFKAFHKATGFLPISSITKFINDTFSNMEKKDTS